MGQELLCHFLHVTMQHYCTQCPHEIVALQPIIALTLVQIIKIALNLGPEFLTLMLKFASSCKGRLLVGIALGL